MEGGSGYLPVAGVLGEGECSDDRRTGGVMDRNTAARLLGGFGLVLALWPVAFVLWLALRAVWAIEAIAKGMQCAE